MEITRWTNSEIDDFAQRVRAFLAGKIGPASQGRRLLDALVAMTGGVIEVTDDPGRQEIDGGSLVIRGEGDYTIILSPFTTPLRDNFTIAHELGHYFLHYCMQNVRPAVPLGFTRYGSGMPEWQANRFAASLLMPEAEFRSKVVEFGRDVYMLAGHFEVSRPAVETRAQSLGCPLA